MELRQYQKECVKALWEHLHAHKNPLAVLPTGAGKSVIIAALVSKLLHFPNARCMILAHRKELIEQNKQKLLSVEPRLGSNTGVFCAALKQKKIKKITFTSIQSAQRSIEAFGKQNLILIDEAHLVPDDPDSSYRKVLSFLINRNPKLKIVGFTATPYRTNDGLLTEGPRPIFTDIAYDISVSELIEQGYLSSLISRRSVTKQIDTSAVKIRAGDFVVSDLTPRVNEIIHSALLETLTLSADRRSWLLFFPSVESAQVASQWLRNAGVSSGCVTGDMDAKERDNTLNDFKRGKIRALCSVDVLTTGFDAPGVDLVVLLRPTKSRGLYVQMVGRGSRLAPFKQNCLVLDYGGNIERFGPIDEMSNIPERREKGGGVAPCKFCENCGMASPTNARYCAVERNGCGQIFPLPEKAKDLKKTASDAELLSSQSNVWKLVGVVAAAHQAKGKDIPVVRLTANALTAGGNIKSASTVLAFEHDGWVRRQALKWWTRYMLDHEIPNSVVDAVAALNTYFQPTHAIVMKNGRYHEIKEFFSEKAPG